MSSLELCDATLAHEIRLRNALFIKVADLENEIEDLKGENMWIRKEKDNCQAAFKKTLRENVSFYLK